jgi:hypothetical protein
MDEILALQELVKLLDQVEPTARERVIRWASSRYGVGPSVPEPRTDRVRGEFGGPRATKTVRNAPKARGKKSAPSIAKDLNLRPPGKQGFPEFAAGKKPKSHQERMLCATYYLKHVLHLESVSLDHVYTCFKQQGWRVPSDLRNALQLVASRKGWLDTSDMEDIRVTTTGENFVEHDLPSPSG